jgi:hypothetical protein
MHTYSQQLAPTPARLVSVGVAVSTPRGARPSRVATYGVVWGNESYMVDTDAVQRFGVPRV